jgi:hypothetical protein
MTIYDDFRAVADDLLAVSDDTFGQLGAIRRRVTDGIGASTPISGNKASTDYPANMAVFPVAQKDIDGTFIKAGDWRVLVSTSGLTIEPTTADKIVCSEGVLSIIDPGKFAPGGTVTHYRMVARK